MKVYFVGDTTDSDNWGSRATTTALERMIIAKGGTITARLFLGRLKERDPFIPNTYWRQANQQVGKTVTRVPVARWVWKQALPTRSQFPSTWAEFDTYAQFILRDGLLPDIRQAIEDADLVVVNGEGLVFGLQQKGVASLFVAYLAKKYFQKPTIYVNHTAEIDHPTMREIVSRVYPLLDDVVFREPISHELCVGYVPHLTDTLAADVAFTYEPIQDEAWGRIAARQGYFSVWPEMSRAPFDPSQPYIAIGGSSVFFRKERDDRGYDPRPAFEQLIQQLQARFGQVVLTAPDHKDRLIMQPVAEKLNLPLIGCNIPVQQAVDILGNARAYISGRWHPSHFALTGGTPIVVMTANTFKTKALLRHMNLEQPTFNSTQLHEEIDSIVALTTDLIAQGDHLRQRLKARVRELAQLSWRNVRYLETFPI